MAPIRYNRMPVSAKHNICSKYTPSFSLIFL
jgi:hypothetical protein